MPIVEMAAVVARYFNLGGHGGGDVKGAAPAATSEQYEELGAQCARALRNLSVHPTNKTHVVRQGAAEHLQLLVTSSNERVSQQARRALKNIESAMSGDLDAKGARK